MSDDEIWDEDQWEAFLREHDRHLDRYMGLLYGFLSKFPPPDKEAPLSEHRAWEQHLQEFLFEKGLEPEDGLFSFLPDDEDVTSDWEEAPLAHPLSISSGNPPSDSSFRALVVYQQALQLTNVVLAWANDLPVEVKDSTLVHFCTLVTQIAGNIAKGHGIGLERDMIGGNIACLKRGLFAANEALRLLGEMQKAEYLHPAKYLAFYEQTFEVRNNVGVYIQDLRARFDLGID